ncbi:hypothetical protein BD560DRAFT_413389 [Blakeslea trispora]|nr:hypothetical protein BD560DRAFT_413389 [Blakeslea trispora]
MLSHPHREQEPNPFEQSFSAIPHKFNLEDSNNTMEKWPSLTFRYDPQSTHQDSYSSISDNQATSEDSSDDPYYQYTFESPHKRTSSHESVMQPQNHRQSKTSANQKKRSKSTKLPEDEEKRKNFLERNRLAALKCRQRKKQWLTNLQARVEFLTNDNEQLQMETDALRKEIMDLKTLLVTHKDCPQYNAAIVQKPMIESSLPSFNYPLQYQHPTIYPPPPSTFSSSMA